MILLSTAILASSCSKKKNEPETPVNPPTSQVEELDITSQATLTVNIENTGGKTAKEGSSSLVDNKLDTKFLIYSFAKTFYMQMEFPTAKQIGSYTLTAGDDADDRDPQTWTLTASVDGSTWVELNAQAYEFFPTRTQTKRYDFINPKAYKFYRLNVTDIRGGSLFQLTEWRLIQMPDSKQRTFPISSVETIVEGKNTLTFVNKTGDLNATVKAGLLNVFKVNYQKMADVYNPAAKDKVIFVIEPGYKGVAATWGGSVIRYDPDWFRNNPKDLDVVTHEMMHVIQSYPPVADAGWVTEGIADYVRFTMGLTNAEANWSLPNFTSSQSYRDAYRVTARFFYWLEKHGYEGIVIKLDKSMRSGAYTTAAFWPANTGKTVDQLWTDYSNNSAL
ncbi:basic secretory peptidase family protein [Pedobacter metabolipauper]|uniref:Basic secretory peptidase family protein n=2 Tax=Pedobacter metabolipauper TaxID=425513 RepID=A0A4R6SRZ2_9SPHI|nr:basic secretory peptidase family protein [Pedobacter metabolipauper]